MTEPIVITIPNAPKPKPSARQGKFGFYNPKSAYMKEVKLLVRAQWAREPILGPVRLNVTYHMRIPKTGPRKSSQEGDWHIIVPDSDNLTKLIKDCMTKIVWKDDCQVCDSRYIKSYSNEPRTEIIVEAI